MQSINPNLLSSTETLASDGYHKTISYSAFFKHAILCSAFLAILSFATLLFNGLNLGIDFKGGTLLEFSIIKNTADAEVANTAPQKHLQEPKDLEELESIRNALALQYEQFKLQKIGNNNFVLKVSADYDSSKLSHELPYQIGHNIKIEQMEFISGQVSKTLITNGIMALVFSTLFIMLYICFRFSWSFGIAAVIALIHNVIIVLGAYALFQFDFSLSTIAALLTIIGYSINDSVVLFDRVRSNMLKQENEIHNLENFEYKTHITNLVDQSITQTMRRIILTSTTTIMASVAMMIFNTSAIALFAGTVAFGIVVGTYSSVFIATAIFCMQPPAKQEQQGQEQTTLQTHD